MSIWFINWSLRHRPLVVVAALVVAVMGYWAAQRLNLDAFPDTTPVQVQINTQVQALVPEEIERQVTVPIELAIGGLPRLEQVRSVSQFGLSQVVVTFADGVDIYFARQLLNERLVTVQLPPGVPRPQLGPVSTGLGEVFHYLLIPKKTPGDNTALTELRTLHDWTVKPALRSTPGTAEINSWGGLEKQYQVRVDPNLLLAHDLSFTELMQAVVANNLNVGGGSINRNRTGDMLLVHGIGRTTTLEQIGNIVITAKDGVPVRVRDVAEVAIGHEIRRGMVTAEGRGEAVLGLGFMLMGENSYRVTKQLRRRLDDLRSRLPDDLELITVYERTELVDQVLDTVRRNLLDGAVLVVMVLFALLGNLRAGLLVALAIPLSLLFALPPMWMAGIAGSLLSLGAIDFGVVVDSSVIMIESAVRRLGHAAEHDTTGASRLDLVRQAAIEVRQPAVFGQLIILIVYLPILVLDGVEGKMFRPMALTVMLVLIGSLITSLTLMPVLASWLLPLKREPREPLVIRLSRQLYEPVLQRVLTWRWSAVGASLAIVGVAAWVAAHLGAEFVPRLSEGAVVIGITRAAGTDLEESCRLNTQIEQLLLAEFKAEIRHVWSRTGGPEVATDPGGIESTDIFVMLTPREVWQRAKTQDELVARMSELLHDIPGQSLWFTQPIEQRLNEMISGVRCDVALKLFGEDLTVLMQKARELEKLLARVPGCTDLTVEPIDGQPMLQVRIDQDAIARYGVPASAVLDIIESIGGKGLGEVVEETRRFPLAARMPEHLQRNPDTIERILVSAPSGQRVPLSRLTDVAVALGPRVVPHTNGQRCLTIQCNVRGRDLSSFVSEAQGVIDHGFELPAGRYSLAWGGQFENLDRATKRLLLAAPAALVLIVVLLWLTYRNLIDTAFVFLSVPVACAGGVVALAMRGMPFSIPAAVGFITLSGMSVLGAMVFCTGVREARGAGLDLRPAIIETKISRLRTVAMTTLVAALGFVPMALSDGVGAEIQRPLATVVIGGIALSTLFDLLLMPALYLMVGPLSQRLDHFQHRRRITDTLDEPATAG